MKEKIIKLLSDLAAFNKLDNTIVSLISQAFDVNAEEICKKNGITYWIKEIVQRERLNEETTDEGYYNDPQNVIKRLLS